MPLTNKDIKKLFRVKPGDRLKLKDHDAAWIGEDEFADLEKDEVKAKAEAFLKSNLEHLQDAQELLWASDTNSLLIVMQAMDAAGKDGTIKHVMSGVNPTGCRVVSFKQPTAHELDHTFLWRCQREAPQRGEIVIFNRSHYEDVIITRVHPELIERSKLPPGDRGKDFWHDRYDDINRWERHLARNGTAILKFYLNVSKDEQKRRFLQRIEHPEKHWKFSPADVRERAHWDDYMNAYEDAISETSTDWAPWYIIPADHKWVMRALVAHLITHTIQSLDLRFPSPTQEILAQMAESKQSLESEGA